MPVDPVTHNYCMNAKKINTDNILKILKDNRDTVFGRKYGFSEIADVNGYRERVPLSDYGSYSEYIERMYENGETDIITSYPVVSFCTTSGTEGAPKHIPFTAEALGRYSDQSERYKNKVMKRVSGSRRLFVNTFHTDFDSSTEKSLLFSEIYNRYLYENGFMDMKEYVGGKPLLFNKTYCNMLYAKVWAAVLEENIVLIESAFLYDVLQFFGYLENNWERLLNDIKFGTVTDDNLPENVKAALLSIKPSEERLNNLREEFSRGFEGIAKRIWKNLSLVCGISTKAFSSEDTELKKYIGDTPLHYLAYCASECYIGSPVRENDFGYVLLPQNGFYEFIPYESSADEITETLLPCELEVGRLYEIVVTNFSGLYRYKIGDVLRVSGFYGESPVLEFEFRKNQALNIAGEKVSTMQLEEAVSRLKNVGVSVSEFSFRESFRSVPARYTAVMIADGGNADAEFISAEADRNLKELNMDYRELRELNYIDCPEIKIVTKEEYAEYIRESLPYRRHNKPVHILPSEANQK